MPASIFSVNPLPGQQHQMTLSSETTGDQRWARHLKRCDNPAFTLEPITGASFGARIKFSDPDLTVAVTALEARPAQLEQALITAGGLLLLPGLTKIASNPELLLRLSRLFGPEVEDYRHTLSTRNLVHPDVPEILVLSNQPPSNRQPPARPDPPLTADGELPVQFPHRKGWHTDQSFRRPPPDVSLFYAVVPSPKGTGQTLYASGTLAYDSLDDDIRQRIESLQGIHALPWTGRSETAVRSGEAPLELLPHQRPQKQPIVRTHPISGHRALYLCEDGQMDWVDGPIDGLSSGPSGDGATLLYELMSHFTQPEFVYAHDWDEGDLLIHDNRNVIHSATWFDTDNQVRHMWRTTVMGNPGPLYDGEPRSWVPPPGVDSTEGLADQTNERGT